MSPTDNYTDLPVPHPDRVRDGRHLMNASETYTVTTADPDVYEVIEVPWPSEPE